MKKSFANFSKGIILGPPTELLADGGVARARGMHPLSLGSFRTRNGSDGLYDLDAHSLTYFNNLFHSGVSTSVYRADVEIQTGLNGNRLSFARMYPTAGIKDYLFCCGGGDLFKIDTAGNVTDWGITPPGNPTAAVSAGGSLTDGSTYSYYITYKNSTTGTRSNANAAAQTVTPSGANLSVTLTFPGASADAQVDKIEIWRTGPDGTTHFYLDEVNDTVASYIDDGSETLSTTALPTNNLKPYDWFDDCLGPFNASMFWITRSQEGNKGRLFYSPIGRAEAVDGFIEVSSDDNPLQKLFLLQGQLGVIAESGIWLIGGTNPYIDRRIPGCPGTTKPHTVAVTPIGMIYEAPDGPYLFDGSTAAPLEIGAVDRIFRGESVENLTDFSGVVAGYARAEYIISDESQTLAFDPVKRRWRDLGIGLSALHYTDEADQIGATLNEQIFDLEKEGLTTDGDNAIEVDLKIPSYRPGDDDSIIIQHIHVDYITGTSALSMTITLDNVDLATVNLTSTTRKVETINISRPCRKIDLRIHGSVTTRCEIFKVTIESHEPGKEDSALTQFLSGLSDLDKAR